MLNKWKWIPNLSFYSGAALGLYALVSAYMGTANGACPIDARRPLMILAVVLLVASIGSQWFLEQMDKKQSTDIADSKSETDTETDTDTDN